LNDWFDCFGDEKLLTRVFDSAGGFIVVKLSCVKISEVAGKLFRWAFTCFLGVL